MRFREHKLFWDTITKWCRNDWAIIYGIEMGSFLEVILEQGSVPGSTKFMFLLFHNQADYDKAAHLVEGTNA